MHQAALRLRTPIAVGRNIDAAHRIGLLTLVGCVDTDRYVTQDRMSLIVHMYRSLLLGQSRRVGREHGSATRALPRRVETVSLSTMRPTAVVAGRPGPEVSTAAYRAGPRSRRGCPVAARPAPAPSRT